MVLVMAAPASAWAQKKKKSIPPAKATVKQPEQAKDTPNIIYERIPAKEQKKQGELVPLYKTKDTVISTQKSMKDSLGKKLKTLPIVYDTVRPKKKLTEEELLAQPVPRDTTIFMGKNKRKGIDTTRMIIVKETGSCKCVDMQLKAQDSVNFEDYVNYTFIFKNNCKDMVYVHSGSFRFTVANVFGRPVKRIRKVDFIKRFDYPEFVPLSPGEVYEFRFADDPFFEYEMERKQQYQFTFMYNNPNRKHRIHPDKTHLCTEQRNHMVFVR